MLIPFRKNGQFGFCNIDQKMRIEPQFRDAAAFSGGTASVTRDGKLWGLIDETGAEVLPFGFENQLFFDENTGLAHFWKAEKQWSVDRKGVQTAAETSPGDTPNVFNPELPVSLAERGGQFFIVNAAKEIILNVGSPFFQPQILDDDEFSLADQTEVCLHDFSGKKLAAYPKTLLTGIDRKLSDGFYLVQYFRDGEGCKNGIMHRDGHFRVPMEQMLFLPEGGFDPQNIMVTARQNGDIHESGWMDFDGKTIEPPRHHYLWQFGKAHFLFKKRDETAAEPHFLVDFRGNRMPDDEAANFRIPHPLFPAGGPAGFTIFLTAHGDAGFMDENGRVIFQQKSNAGCGWHGAPTVFYFQNDGEKNFVDTAGKLVFKTVFPESAEPSRHPGFWNFSGEKGLLGLLDKNFRPVFSNKKPLNNIEILADGRFFQLFFADGKQAVHRADGTKINMPTCDFIFFRGDFFLFAQNQPGQLAFAGSTDLAGETIVPPVHLFHFSAETGPVLACFERNEPRSRQNFGGQNYWVDFSKNTVFRDENHPLPTPEDFKPLDLQSLKTGKPTDRWASRAPYFSPETAAIAAQILDNFIDEVDALPKKSLQKALRDSVKKAVFALHDFNENHQTAPNQPPLETLERDEIVPFILSVAAAKGLDTGADITEGYRLF